MICDVILNGIADIDIHCEALSLVLIESTGCRDITCIINPTSPYLYVLSTYCGSNCQNGLQPLSNCKANRKVLQKIWDPKYF